MNDTIVGGRVTITLIRPGYYQISSLEDGHKMVFTAQEMTGLLNWLLLNTEEVVRQAVTTGQRPSIDVYAKAVNRRVLERLKDEEQAP